MSKLKSSAVHITDTHGKNPPGGGSLHLMGSLFWVSVQKNTGTEDTLDPTDDRNSTSYSGTESSWYSTRERYGEDTFFCMSVWYDDEYGV